MKSDFYFSLARAASRKSDHHTYQMGCAIGRGGKLLGVGHNQNKTHPRSPHSFKSIHAEFMAAMDADFDIEGATVYIFRESKSGEAAMARPCPDCWKFLRERGVKQVIYSCEGDFKMEKVS